ncbi:MAG: glycerol-3-phosphate 1-O-acyltransferase PlsY [Nitrospirae bacterium]|nr:glycerol-3-phosphate 1-O-acyltransferase PlsY [Nitrospirota bacterium]
MIFAVCLVAFSVGSIPTGLLIARTKGIDLRNVGSGNIGATNVMRAVGKKEALFTLLGDIGKGAVAVVFAMSFSLDVLGQGIAGLCAVLGHNFSIFLKFKGGKGVATSLGVMLAYSPHVGLFTATLWLLSAKFTKYSSLSALIAFGFLPISIYMLDMSPEKFYIAIALAGMLFIRHSSNIKRLIQGTESRIGQR